MNADLTAIIADELAMHYNAGHDYRGTCSCGHAFEGWPAFCAHQAEQIAARLLELPAPTFARWWCDDRAERVRALGSP